MEWQPIETAPKDGTKVLLFLQGGRASKDGLVAGSFVQLSSGVAGWAIGVRGNTYCFITQPPTHWMPLPPPPDNGTPDNET